MKYKKQLESIGLLFELQGKWSHRWIDWIIPLMMEELRADRSHILKGYYSSTDMPEVYDLYKNSIWDFLTNLAEEEDTTVLAYIAEYAKLEDIDCYQCWTSTITNLAAMKMSECVWLEITKKGK